MFIVQNLLFFDKKPAIKFIKNLSNSTLIGASRILNLSRRSISLNSAQSYIKKANFGTLFDNFFLIFEILYIH